MGNGRHPIMLSLIEQNQGLSNERNGGIDKGLDKDSLSLKRKKDSLTKIFKASQSLLPGY